MTSTELRALWIVSESGKLSFSRRFPTVEKRVLQSCTETASLRTHHNTTDDAVVEMIQKQKSIQSIDEQITDSLLVLALNTIDVPPEDEDGPQPLKESLLWPFVCIIVVSAMQKLTI